MTDGRFDRRIMVCVWLNRVEIFRGILYTRGEGGGVREYKKGLKLSTPDLHRLADGKV